MSARFDPEQAHRLRESEAEWLRQSASRIRAARSGHRPDRYPRQSREDAR